MEDTSEDVRPGQKRIGDRSTIAGRWGLDADDDRFETAMLRFGFPAGGCSVAWIPLDRTVSGTPLVSHNFDFTTQTLSELQGRSPASDEPILAGQPYIIETYPDESHATLIVCLFDLASGAGRRDQRRRACGRPARR